jgi:poly(A) polymerase
MQPRFRFRSGKRALRLLGHPRFRAAYDFMCLRAAAGEELGDDCQWWTQIQEQAPEEQRRMTAGGPKRPRRRRRTKPRAQDVGV